MVSIGRLVGVGGRACVCACVRACVCVCVKLVVIPTELFVLCRAVGHTRRPHVQGAASRPRLVQECIEADSVAVRGAHPGK